MAKRALYHGVSPGHLLVLAAALLILAPAPGRPNVLYYNILRTGPQPWYLCGIGNGGNFEDKSSYQANIKLLSTTLPKNASSNLFAKDSAGDVPNIVYALALCRGDLNASACESCVTTAFVDAQQVCPLNKDAAVYYDRCYLRFSNTNFFATASNGDPSIYLVSMKNVTRSLVRAFDAAVAALLDATANYAVTNSTKLYATGEEAFDSNYPIIYGLSQCTPDLSPAECRSCLGDVADTVPPLFSGGEGARIIGMRCNFRYEVYPFFNGSLSLRLPAPSPAPAPTVTLQVGRSRNKTGTILAIALPIAAAVLAVTLGYLCFIRRRPSRERPPYYSTNPAEDIESFDSLLLDISTLRAATDNFDEDNKLGEGGFGAVYKGILPDGQEIAVKRLSQSSGQGIQELKNELVLVAKLQHKNLVRLLGVCLQEHEKMLVYEYMPNRSIDTILFDTENSKQLDWGKRLKIINGIARGLQYLHEESQLKIIHRDLKASNVLLDSDYIPKISDFGLARLFGGDQSREITNRVVGTYGYIAPEYAIQGHYSTKSDVFSFGILILEILTGRKSTPSFTVESSMDLLSLVWRHWTRGTIVEIIDPYLGNAPSEQMLKCVHIGLLCVQANPVDRPMMSEVNIMLSTSTVSLAVPLRPVLFILETGTYTGNYSGSTQSTDKSAGVASPNEVSVSELDPR